MSKPKKISRERGGDTYVDVNQILVVNGNPSVYAVNHTFTSVDYEKTNGVTTPNFYQRRKRGELLPYTWFEQYHKFGNANGWYDITRTNVSPNERRYSDGPYCNHLADCVHTPEECSEIVSQFSADQYVQSAAASIYSRGWDALTFLAELRETIEMFRKFVPKLAKFIQRARERGFFASIKPSTVQGAWLEGRYGMRPLIYDVQDISDALANLDSKITRFKERHGLTHRWAEDLSSGGHVHATGVDTYDSIVQYELSLRGSVVADIIPPRLQFNPVITLWERTTLSFVLDWAIDVGTMLEAASFVVFSSDYVASEGYYLTIDHSFDVNHVNGSGFTGPGHGEENFARTEYTLRLPTKVSLIPQLKFDLDLLKMLDITSIIRKALR